MISRLLILSACVALVCGSQSHGSVFLVGGAEDDNNTEIYGGMITAAGGREAVVAVITAPGEDPCCDPDSSWVLYKQIFSSYAPKDIWWVPIDEDNIANNKNPEVAANLSKSTLFFFSGGDQDRVIDSFFVAPNHTDSLALKAIRARFESTEGTVIAGTSAGTACQTAKVMFMDGESYSALVNGSFAYNSTGEDNLLYNPLGGLGFFPLLIDTHFSERGRQGRLVRLLADTQHQPRGAATGFGVDQNTSLATASAANEYRIVGSGGVWWFNVSGAVVDSVTVEVSHPTPAPAGPGPHPPPTSRAATTAAAWTIRGVRASYATRGDTLGSDGRVRPASWKVPLHGRESHPRPETSTNILNSPYAPDYPTTPQFSMVATSLLDSRAGRMAVGRTFETNPRYCVVFDRDYAMGWAGQDLGRRYVSIENISVSFHPADHHGNCLSCPAGLMHLRDVTGAEDCVTSCPIGFDTDANHTSCTVTPIGSDDVSGSSGGSLQLDVIIAIGLLCVAAIIAIILRRARKVQKQPIQMTPFEEDDDMLLDSVTHEPVRSNLDM